MFTKRDDGDADQVESSISRLAGWLAITGNGRRRAQRRCIMCIAPVIGQLRAMVQAPVSGNEAHVAGWVRPAGPVVSVVRI